MLCVLGIPIWAMKLSLHKTPLGHDVHLYVMLSWKNSCDCPDLGTLVLFGYCILVSAPLCLRHVAVEAMTYCVCTLAGYVSNRSPEDLDLRVGQGYNMSDGRTPFREKLFIPTSLSKLSVCTTL